jgi:recombination associated protein RdgC
MGFLSAAVSLTRYRVDGDIEKPLIEIVAKALKKNAIDEIDNEPTEKAVGWTSFDTPYKPDFEGSSFSIGAYLIFAMRIDKKTSPPKLITKHATLATARRLAETGRTYLSRDEKKEIREHVINVLNLRVPAVPNTYDVLWNPETHHLCFFSNLKSANEEFETLFHRSFNLMPIRLFPYTTADLHVGLGPGERDVLNTLTPTRFLP